MARHSQLSILNGQCKWKKRRGAPVWALFALITNDVGGAVEEEEEEEEGYKCTHILVKICGKDCSFLLLLLGHVSFPIGPHPLSTFLDARIFAALMGGPVREKD